MKEIITMTPQNHAGVLGTKLNHLPLKLNGADAAALTRSTHVTFVLVVGLFVAAWLWDLAAYSLSTDEIFSLLAARYDWSGLIAFVVEDVNHPPLFYLLLKLWIGIGGESLLWLKLFPALTAIATIIPFFFLCRELKLQATEVTLALLLMAVNGYLIYFAQELRMYSLLLFFTVCSLWLFVRFFNSEIGSKKKLWALFAVNILLVYTHYFGWLVVGVEFIFLLFGERRKLKSFLLLVAGLILCSSPWAYAVAQALRRRELGENLAWMERPDLYSLLEYYALLNGRLEFRWHTYLRLLLFGCPILLWAWYVLTGAQAEDKRRRRTTFWWLFLFSFLPVAISYSVSQVLTQPVWHPRYLIIVAVPYMILVAVAVHQLRPNWIRTVIMVLIVGWAAVAGFREINNIDPSPRLSNHKVAWEALIRQMIQAEPPQANVIKVYAFEWMIAIPVAFYLDEARERRFQVVQVVDDGHYRISGLTINQPFWTVRQKETSALEGDHFWVALHKYRRQRVEKILRASGYQIGESFEEPRGYILFPVWRR